MSSKNLTPVPLLLTCRCHFFIAGRNEEVHGPAGIRPLQVRTGELSLRIAHSVLQSAFVELMDTAALTVAVVVVVAVVAVVVVVVVVVVAAAVLVVVVAVLVAVAVSMEGTISMMK